MDRYYNDERFKNLVTQRNLNKTLFLSDFVEYKVL